MDVLIGFFLLCDRSFALRYTVLCIRVRLSTQKYTSETNEYLRNLMIERFDSRELLNEC